MADIRVVSIASAFRFEIIQALRLLTSDQSDHMQIVRLSHPDFVPKWYDAFASLRDAIDAALAPGSYWLSEFLLEVDDSFSEMLEAIQELERQLADGATKEALGIGSTDSAEVWRAAAAALTRVLPEFNRRCFRAEWERWKPVLDAAGHRVRNALEGRDVFGAMEAFTGRRFGPLELTIHLSEFVRPSAFVLHRGNRMAIVGQHQASEIWHLVGIAHETGHVLFNNPGWFEALDFTEDDMAWVESILPTGWRSVVDWSVRGYFQETFLDAMAFSVALGLLPGREEEVRKLAAENFTNRGLLLGPCLFEATLARYDPQAFASYDAFLLSLVRQRALTAV